MARDTWILDMLHSLRERNLLRSTVSSPGNGAVILRNGKSLINFSSNDYLDLIRHPVVIDASRRLLDEAGAGAGASRLVTGTLDCHELLERRLAALKGYQSCLLFGSGFLANLGTVCACVGRTDHVFADRLIHASLIDAIALSKASLHRFNHNDCGHLRSLLSACPAHGVRLIVTESVFSMDGDCAPLEDICGLAEQYDALVLVDEAHATGVFGPGGTGRINEFHLESRIPCAIGTLSKALGGYGGFIACAEPLRDLLINRARSFIYSTALPPAVIGAALGALDVLREEPERGARLLGLAGHFRSLLKEGGLDTGASASQIVPVMIGDPAVALSLSRRLLDEGICAVAIRPPTVPEGSARLRLSLTLGHSAEILTHVARTIIACARKEHSI